MFRHDAHGNVLRETHYQDETALLRTNMSYNERGYLMSVTKNGKLDAHNKNKNELSPCAKSQGL